MYVSVCVVLRVRVVDQPANSGAGHSRGHAAGRSRARGGGHGGVAARRRAAEDSDSEDEASFQSYDDPEDGESPVPPFTPFGTPGFKLPEILHKGLPRHSLFFF